MLAEIILNDLKQLPFNEETEWRCIGYADKLEIARHMVEKDLCSYKDPEGFVTYLDCEPSDECYNNFVKIEYDDTIEYYDCYQQVEGKRYARRFLEEN